MSASLTAKLGSRERLKVRSRCGCSLCLRQMRCTLPTEMPMALAIARPVQWVAWCGGSVQGSAPTRAVVFAPIGALPGFRGLFRRRPSPPAPAKRFFPPPSPRPPAPRPANALPPPPYRRPADPDALCPPLRRVPIRRGEHNARPLDVLARPVAVGRDRDQLLTLRVVQNYADLLCHGPQPQCHGPVS